MTIKHLTLLVFVILSVTACVDQKFPNDIEAYSMSTEILNPEADPDTQLILKTTNGNKVFSNFHWEDNQITTGDFYVKGTRAYVSSAVYSDGVLLIDLKPGSGIKTYTLNIEVNPGESFETKVDLNDELFQESHFNPVVAGNVMKRN